MKHVMIIMLSVLLFVISGCARNNAAQYKTTPQNQPIQQLVTYQNKALAEKQEELLNLQREYDIRKYVVKTDAIELDKLVKATITVENSTSDRDAKELGKEYIEDLKQVYKKKRIEVDVVRNGQLVTTLKRKPLLS